MKDFQVQGYSFASGFLLMSVVIFFSPIFIGFPCALIMLSVTYEMHTAFFKSGLCRVKAILDYNIKVILPGFC